MKLKNSVALKDERRALKDQALEIFRNAKKEIRELTEEEQYELQLLKDQIASIDADLEELKKRFEVGDEERDDEEPTDEEKEEINEEEIKEEERMRKSFSLIKSIRNIANNKQLDECGKAVTEQGLKEMRKSGLSYGGQIQIPVNELRAISVASEGEDVVATDVYDVLEPLRAKNVLVQAGAKFLTNLVGDVQVPTMNGSNVYWEGETASAKDGGATFDSVKLSPNRLTAYLDVTKQFINQDSASAEEMLRNDLVNAINSKLESTILGDEEGTATQPQGLFYLASGDTATTVSTFANVCDLEAEVEDANVMGECKYIMSNKAKAKFRNMPKSTKSTELVMQEGKIDGTDVYATSNVSSTNVAYGDWSNLAIGQWGAIDLTVDPYSVATEGKVRLVVNAYFDAKVLRKGAIVTAKA